MHCNRICRHRWIKIVITYIHTYIHTRRVMNAARIKDHHHHHYWQQQQQQQIFTGWLRQPVDWAGWLKSTVNKVVLRRRLPFSFLSMLQWLPRPWSLTSHFRRLCTALQFAGKHFCLIQFFCVFFFAFYFLNAVNGHLNQIASFALPHLLLQKKTLENLPAAELDLSRSHERKDLLPRKL